MNQAKYNLIAIDVAKDSLQIQSPQRAWQVPNTENGLKRLNKALQALKNPWIVCEATGGYEQRLLQFAHKKALPVTLINPARVRAFAKSEGLKAKSDPIDAALLLRFAKSKDLKPTPSPSPQQQTLQALMDRRSQLTESLAREKNRLQKSPQCVRKSIEKMIGIIEEELAQIDNQIERLIDQYPLMNQQSSKMQSVSGIGKTTAWAILAYLSEINSLKRNQLVALAGIAPFNKDSGKYRGKRRIEGGRAKVRKCLYMAAQSAAIHNQHIKEYVDGLRARGKPYKCAIVAAMRKLLIHIQSILKNTQFSLA